MSAGLRNTVAMGIENIAVDVVAKTLDNIAADMMKKYQETDNEIYFDLYESLTSEAATLRGENEDDDDVSEDDDTDATD